MAIDHTLKTPATELAAAHLLDRGLEIIDTGWRCRYGELSFVARESDITAFVGLTIRTSRAMVSDRTVPYSEQQKTRRLALLWLNEQTSRWRKVRFDTITVFIGPEYTEPRIEYTAAAF